MQADVWLCDRCATSLMNLVLLVILYSGDYSNAAPDGLPLTSRVTSSPIRQDSHIIARGEVYKPFSLASTFYFLSPPVLSI